MQQYQDKTLTNASITTFPRIRDYDPTKVGDYSSLDFAFMDEYLCNHTRAVYIEKDIYDFIGYEFYLL